MADAQRISPEIRGLHVPAPLRDLPLWLTWAYEQHPGEAKPRKVPQYSMGGRRHGQQGSPQDRAKLTTFAVARDAAAKRGLDGVGFALMPDTGIIALDFDHCVSDGKVDRTVRELVQGTYAELSPSGTGVRAFFTGAPDVLGNKKSHATGEQFGAETFSSTGFVTVTGWMLDHVEMLGWEDKIAPVPQRVIEFCAKRFGNSSPAFDPDDFMIGREPRLGLTVTQMEELLDALDADMSRDEWVRVGMALHHECDGDDTGFDLWNEWSSNGGKYPSEEALRQQWDSFDRRKGAGRRQVTMASVIKMAKEAGFTRPQTATAEDLRRVAEEAAGEPPAEPETPAAYDGKFRITRAAEVAMRPPGKWWVKGLIPQAQIGAIYGASGSGKSFLALDFMAHLSLGREWRGHRVRQARGLYVAAEGGTGVGKRIKAWAQHNNVALDDLDIGVLTVAPNIMLKEDISELVRAVTMAGGFDYIVLDTYAQVTPGANENAAEDMGLALAHCRALNEATGALVILIHHSGKDASRGVRGWSGINAALDFAIETSRDDNGYREAKITKMKDGEDGLTYGFKLDVVSVGMDEDGDEVTSCVIDVAEAPKGEKTAGKGAKRRGRWETHLLEVMAMFPSESEISTEHLIATAIPMLPVPENGSRDVRRQSLVRALQTLSREKDGPLQVVGGKVFFYEP